MKTAEDIINKHKEVIQGTDGVSMNIHIANAMREYAEQAIQEVLKRAAENAWNVSLNEEPYVNVVQSSILNTEYKDLLK